MKKRFPARTFTIFCVAVLAALTATVDRATAADKPNIILILSDDFG